MEVAISSWRGWGTIVHAIFHMDAGLQRVIFLVTMVETQGFGI